MSSRKSGDVATSEMSPMSYNTVLDEVVPDFALAMLKKLKWLQAQAYFDPF